MRNGIILTWLLATTTFPGLAVAQDAPPPDTAAVAADPQDIIVTAQRRSERLSRTPVSVAVVSGDTLAKAQITTEQDLRVATPGLGIRGGNGSNQINYVIRGQSQDPFSNSRPGVLPYINEVQINGTGASSAFYDLQSVQVLKGPQGTLFGRSATGGAVLFTTAKPTDEFGGYVSGSLGNYDARKLEGAINVPLAGDQIMSRVSGFYQKRDGYQRDVYNDTRGGDIDRYGVRGSLTAKLGPAITNELVVDFYHANNTNVTPVLSGFLAPSAGSPYPYVPLALLYGGVTNPTARATGIGILQAFTGLSQTAAASQYDNYFAAPNHPKGGFAGVLATQQATGPYVINSDSANVARIRNTILTNTTTIDLNDHIHIKNIFGYTALRLAYSLDADGTPYAASQGTLTPISGQNNKAASEELQLGGKALDGRLDFVFGGYFSHENSRIVSAGESFDLVAGAPVINVGAFRLINTTYAGYAQGTYHLNDALAFTLGGRYTDEKVQYNTLPADTHYVFPVPAGQSYDQDRAFKKFSWTVGLQDQIDPNLLIYTASRRAYKSGGFNGVLAPIVGSAAVGGNGFGAQKTTDLEVGAKFQGHLVSMPARLNVAGYRIWITDEQRTVYALPNGSPSTLTVNVPKTDSYGVELDGQLQPAPWLGLGVTGNYLHSKFGSAPVGVLGVLQVFDQVPDSPKFTGSVYADIDLPISGAISGLVHGDVYRQSRSTISTSSTNIAGATINGYTLADFRLGVQNKDAGWSLIANLKNAFNRTFYVGGLPLGQITGDNTLLPGEPRTVTVEARLKF